MKRESFPCRDVLFFKLGEVINFVGFVGLILEPLFLKNFGNIFEKSGC